MKNLLRRIFSKVVVWLRTWREMKVESVYFPVLKSELDFVTTARNDALLKLRVASGWNLGETDRISAGHVRWLMLAYEYGHHHGSPAW